MGNVTDNTRDRKMSNVNSRIGGRCLLNIKNVVKIVHSVKRSIITEPKKRCS